MTAGNPFYFLIFFFSLPVEQSCEHGSKTVCVEILGKKLIDISLELDYSSESYMSCFGIFPF